MDLEKTFGTDESLVEKGVFVNVGDAEVRIRKWENEDFNRLFRKKMQPYRGQSQNGTLGDGVAEEIMDEVIAETIIVDWENVTRGGDEVECNTENVLEALEDYPEFREEIINQAQTISNFQKNQLEEDEKN
jgi:hypothetical protein